MFGPNTHFLNDGRTWCIELFSPIPHLSKKQNNTIEFEGGNAKNEINKLCCATVKLFVYMESRGFIRIQYFWMVDDHAWDHG